MTQGIEARLAAAGSHPTWCLDALLQKEAGYIDIAGWAVVPPKGSLPAFTLDGEVFEFSQTFRRPDLVSPHPFGSAEVTGFYCRHPRELRDGDELAFRYADALTLKPFREEDTYYYRHLDDLSQRPDGNLRRRVHGSDIAASFLFEGYSTFVKLERALIETTGKRYSDFASILDWGCGCGRVARYFRDVEGPRYRGVDIDGENARWCAEHLGFGCFERVPLLPPTDLPEGGFDLIFGVSVVTHLREDDERQWLAELARLSPDGGIVLLTTHGDASLWRSILAGAALNRQALDQLESRGFLDAGGNADLEGVVSDSEYYRNTFHTEASVRGHWSKYGFEIECVIPAYIGNQQDLVVMRRTNRGGA
jgi:SAM-dependent methyltransferase